MKNYEKK